MNESLKLINHVEQISDLQEGKKMDIFFNQYSNSPLLLGFTHQNLPPQEIQYSVKKRIEEKISELQKNFDYENNKQDLSEIISIIDDFPFEYSWTKEDLEKKILPIILKKYKHIDNPLEILTKIKFHRKIVDELSCTENGSQSEGIQKLINDYIKKIEKDNPELPLAIPSEKP